MLALENEKKLLRKSIFRNAIIPKQTRLNLCIITLICWPLLMHRVSALSFAMDWPATDGGQRSAISSQLSVCCWAKPELLCPTSPANSQPSTLSWLLFVLVTARCVSFSLASLLGRVLRHFRLKKKQDLQRVHFWSGLTEFQSLALHPAAKRMLSADFSSHWNQ